MTEEDKMKCEECEESEKNDEKEEAFKLPISFLEEKIVLILLLIPNS